MGPTLEQLKKIIKDREDEQYRRRLCLKENLCPECGSLLIEKEKTEFLLYIIPFSNFSIKSCISCNFSHKEEFLILRTI